MGVEAAELALGQGVGVGVADTVRPDVRDNHKTGPGSHAGDLHADARLGRPPQADQGHAAVVDDGADLVHGGGLGLAVAAAAGVFRDIAKDVGIAGDALLVGAGAVAEVRGVSAE